MLLHLRTRVAETLAETHHALLATCGPADIQAGVYPCEAEGVYLYVLVPRTSDHLYNLEVSPDVVVTTHRWQARGKARVLAPGTAPEIGPCSRTLTASIEAEWSVLLEITPTRLQIAAESGGPYVETIDIDSES
jgi:hypothetical protein